MNRLSRPKSARAGSSNPARERGGRRRAYSDFLAAISDRLRPASPWAWVCLTCVLASLWACRPPAVAPEPAPNETSFDEAAFWKSLPWPDDAEEVEVGEGFDRGFVTRMVEPELFDFFANWLTQQGWQRQAPTEAMVSLPHQTWRKHQADPTRKPVQLLIEIRGLDEQGRTVVWLQVEEKEP